MSLPYSYKSKFVFNSNETFERKYLTDLFFSVLTNDDNFKDVKKHNDKLYFKSKKSLLNFFYQSEIDINTNANKIIVNYKLNLVEIIVISIFLFVFIPFFSKFSLNSFFIFSIIIILVFYTANVIFMAHQLYLFIKKLLITNKIVEEINLSGEQQDWINNPNKCPACGCDINENTIFCPDCGLKISQNPYTKPLDLSKKQNSHQLHNQQINYHFKEKK